MSDIWNTIADERGALATDLADLTPEQWDAPSLCPGWTVRDLVAHLSATASLNPATFFAAMAKARFNFDRFANRQIAKHLGPDPVATLTEFRVSLSATDDDWKHGQGETVEGPAAVAAARHDRAAQCV